MPLVIMLHDLLARVDEVLASSDCELDPRVVAMLDMEGTDYVLDLAPRCALSDFCNAEILRLAAERDNSFLPVGAYKRIAVWLEPRVKRFSARQRWVAVLIVALNIASRHPGGGQDGGDLLRRVLGFVLSGECRRVVDGMIRALVDKGMAQEAMDGYLRRRLRHPEAWDLVTVTVDRAIRQAAGGIGYCAKRGSYGIRSVRRGDDRTRKRFASDSAAYRSMMLMACALAAEYPVHFSNLKRALVNMLLYWLASNIRLQCCGLEEQHETDPVTGAPLNPRVVTVPRGAPFPIYDAEQYALCAACFCSLVRKSR